MVHCEDGTQQNREQQIAYGRDQDSRAAVDPKAYGTEQKQYTDAQ